MNFQGKQIKIGAMLDSIFHRFYVDFTSIVHRCSLIFTCCNGVYISVPSTRAHAHESTKSMKNLDSEDVQIL